MVPTPAPAPQAQPAAKSQPSFDDDAVEPQYTPSSTASQSLDDSLVLDETIIDELIDDISMTASVVTEMPAPPEGPVFDSGPVSEVHHAPPTSRATPIPTHRPVGVTSSVLEKLSSARTEVEILLLGSDTTINGVLTWNENGLIGVESGDDLYTIPLSSVSFIRSRT